MDADGHTEARGHVAVLLKNVPACRALVTELKQLRWHDERDDESGRAQSFCSFTLHAELRGSQVWVVGTRVSGGSEQGNETEPIQPIQIGDWPGVLACGRQM